MWVPPSRVGSQPKPPDLIWRQITHPEKIQRPKGQHCYGVIHARQGIPVQPNRFSCLVSDDRAVCKPLKCLRRGEKM